MTVPRIPVVRVRTLIFFERAVVIVRDQRLGQPHLTLPGGRVKEDEGVEQAAVREVTEETGLEVEIGPLVYVTETHTPGRRLDLDLIFRAVAHGSLQREGVELLSLDSEQRKAVLPPVLGRVREDLDRGWPQGARWLGNVWRPELAAPR